MEKFTPNFSKGCSFCNAGEKEIDYKDVRTLKRFIAENDIEFYKKRYKHRHKPSYPKDIPKRF